MAAVRYLNVIPFEESGDEGTGRAAGADQQPILLQADTGSDSRT